MTSGVNEREYGVNTGSRSFGPIVPQVLPDRRERRPKATQFLDVLARQLLETALTDRGEGHAHGTRVVWIRRPDHQPVALGTVDDLDRGVVPNDQELGNLADPGSLDNGAAANSEEQLMDRGVQPRLCRGVLAPAQEPAKPRPELQQAPVVIVRRGD